MKHKGSIYFLTLSSAVLLMTMVLGLSVLIMKQRRIMRTQAHVDEATLCAELGIRHALYFTKEAANWRTLLPSGEWLTDITNGPSSYWVSGIDTADADLQNASDDPVQLTCIAKVGNVQRTLTVQCEQPVSELLLYGAASDTEVKVSQSGQINGNAFSNGNVNVIGGGASINGDAEAVGTISGNVTGTVLANSVGKSMPDKAAIMSYYYSIATTIPHQPLISGILLSPTNNPFGPTNSEGVYLMPCSGGGVTISDCRIVGTLILENSSGSSCLADGINWQPARPDYPALIINQQGFNIYFENGVDEALLGVDLSLPSESGSGSRLDYYPKRLQGAIYVDGYVYIYKTAYILGPVITTDFCWIKDSAFVAADPALYDKRPPGFVSSHLVPVKNTWQEVMPTN